MFSIGFLTLDLIIILAIAIAFFFISLIKGEYVLARFLVAFYPTTLIYLNLPYFLPTTSISKIVTYFVLFIFFAFLLKRSITASRSYNNAKKFTDALLLSVSSVLTLMTIYYHIIPLESIVSFSLPFSNYLTSVIPLGVWFMVPLVTLFITNRHHS